ncbi:GGDEF domain-containing protein [Zoogloea dura]|jgi:diguanylate cyclase (GGDEF)-like protein|uniref:diguanylate cyclase n=1 Tax=Zoogloea dura TaxID=2728840 RepID=A0A848G5K4_9RHOO|nr:diguanylate cyclase [Zoogloea dura]NML26225.1 diguanylate cyclase [Zoogloea dura]
MYAIDIKTTILLLALGNALIASFFVVCRSWQEFPARYVWGRVAQAAGWILFFHRPVLPLFLWYVAGNGLLIVGWILEVLAILAIERRNPRLERVYVLIAVLGLGSLLLNFSLDASYNVMNLSISVLLVAIFCIPAYMLTFGRESSSFTRAVGFFYLLYCLINVVRAIYVVHTDNVSVMVGNLMHSVVFLGLFALLIFGSVGYMLLLREKTELELLHAARTDDLTGLFNRRAFFSHAQLAMGFASRSWSPVSFLMLDVDHFKQLNDQFGHPAGDAALRALARTVEVCIRPQDVFGRLGGEEFGLLLVCPTDNALMVAERIREQVERLKVVELPGAAMTVSIGVASLQAVEGWDVEQLMQEADRQLYQAKLRGRNQVVATRLLH